VKIRSNKIQRKLASLISLGLLVIGLQGNSHAASVLAFDQAMVDTTVDSQFSLDIVTKDFPSTFGGSILINFDPTVVNVSDIALASPWSGITLMPSDNSGINLAGILLHAPIFSQWPAGDFVFATLTFTALAIGSSELALSTYESLPLSTIGRGGFTPIDFTAVNSTVTVSAVPIPAAVWLLLSGFIGLFSVAKKKRGVATTQLVTA